MKLHQSLQTMVLAGIVAGGFAAACSADIIYQDTFARGSAGTPIVGSAPTTDNSGLGAHWSNVVNSATGYVSTGTNCSVANTYWDTMNLPLDWATFENPRVQADVIFTASRPVDELFFQLILGDCNYWSSAQTAILRVAGDGHAWVMSGGQWGWDTNIDCGVVGNPGGYNHLQINYSNTLGTASFFVNTTEVAADIPLVNWWSKGVGLGYNGWNPTTITNFLVSYRSEETFPVGITNQPQGSTIFVGDPLQISLVSTGSLPITYTWYKNGVALPDHNSSIFSVASAALSDSGNYKVVVHNGYGPDVESSTVRVDVHVEAQTPLAQINFDDITNNLYEFAFAFAADSLVQEALVAATGTTNEPGAGVGGSVGLRLFTDGSALADYGDGGWSGFGGGVGLALPKLATGNLNFFEAYASVHIENLKPELTNAPGRVAVRFYIPNPVKADDYLMVGSSEQGVTYTSNYQAFAFILNRAYCDFKKDGQLVDGVASMWQNFSNVVRCQFEFTVDNFYADYTAGPGTAVVVDNLKLNARQFAPSPVTINSISGSTLSYSGGDGMQCILLGTSDLSVPLASWSRLATNTVALDSTPAILATPGTFTIPVGASSQFFRIKCE